MPSKRYRLILVTLSMFMLLILSGCGDDTSTEQDSPPLSNDTEDVLITTGQLPSGTVDTAYSTAISASGGTQPYTWSVLSGALPLGLSLNASTGYITGTPEAAGTSILSIRVEDALSETSEQSFTLSINGGSPLSGCDCGPDDTVIGTTITVSTVQELVSAVNQINSGTGNMTVLIETGTYSLSSMLYITKGNVVFRSTSGNRNDVILEGDGMTGGVPHIFLVAAANITIADLSLGEVANHGIQVQGENGADHLTVHNVRIFNTGEQMLKGSFGGVSGSDSGIVECSLFEYTSTFGPQYYIGGIDVHRGRNWVVRNNTFRNIRSPENRIAEHAIHFWSDSETPLIERNTIINCDRGIGLGLGDSGCTGGTIRNNMIYANDQGINNDVGIALESASDVTVSNNTIYFDHSYPNAIEYRFVAATGNVIVNNLTNKAITSRNSGSASVRSNVTSALDSWFDDPTSGDLHLAASISSVVDAGENLAGTTRDIDCDSRPIGGGVDIGADEYQD